MDYLIYARKFRPQVFEEVVGQETITTTLKNAIRQERVSQSFLFSGPRGVGKTSTARILAKALNCTKGPTLEPCGKCVSCKEIEQGNSMDVLEIDGASNRGIEEIRNLRETVKYKPSAGHYKIYIIDEVHMLTTEAFNALLKTLEEPPAHVKFIFATTESHKVPLTILSRCQRFQFKRIPVPEVVEKLSKIAQKEKLKCEKNALFLIAKAADGALRDAESLLDQLASFSEGKIQEKDVLTLLGLASDETYLTVLSAIREQKGAEVFEIIKKLYEDGGDLAQFARGLFEIFRHLLILKTAPTADVLVEMDQEMIAKLRKKAELFSPSELLLALAILQNLQAQLRRPVASPRLLVETAVLKLVYLDGLKKVEDLARVSKDAGRSGPVLKSPAEKKTPDLISASPSGEGQSSPDLLRSKKTSPAEATPALGVKDAVKKISGDQAFALDDVERIWPQVIDYVKAKRMSTSLFLAESEPVEVEGMAIVLALPSEFRFHKETLEKEANKQLVDEAFTQVLGKKAKVQFVVAEKEGMTQEISSEEEESSPPAENVPDIVAQALEIFDGSKVIRRE